MTPKDFYGEVNGDTINGFYKYLDKGIRLYKDRLTQVNKVYYADEACTQLREIWLDLFENDRIKVNLNSSDSVMSETNVCKLQEACCTYLLFADDVDEILNYPEGEKVKVLQPIKMQKGEEKTRSYEAVIQSDDAERILYVEPNTSNYKNQVKQVINSGDFKDEDIAQILTCYKALVDEIDLELEVLKRMRDDEDESNRVYAMNRIRILSAIKTEVTTFDMIQVKDQIKKTIYFKAIGSSMPVEPYVNLENFDYWDKELVRLLAKCESGKCDSEFGKKYAEKFENAYDVVSITMSDEDFEMFELWKRGSNLQEYSDEYDINHKSVHSRVKAILTLIQRQMIEDYELDYYYTEQVRGKWKTCSKCGEVKIANEYYFNKEKKGKYGFQAHCRICEAERKK